MQEGFMRKFAVGACIFCCAANLLVIFGAGSILTSLAVLGQSPIAFIAFGFALIGTASYLIWKRGRKAACCEVVKT